MTRPVDHHPSSIIPKGALVPRKIAQSFLAQRYPLSDVGKDLFRRTEKALSQGSEALLLELRGKLPTVENPRLELFADLKVSSEEADSLFGINLANVQVTKGCRHKCTHCAASAAAHVDIMPFAAVLKIAEKKKGLDHVIKELLEDFFAQAIRLTGYHPQEILRDDLSAECAEKLVALYKAHRVSHYLPWDEKFDQWEAWPYLGYDVARFSTYYDSDPFDYRDSHFLHEDGSPADFGDVFRALSSKMRPMFTTTAGWPVSDKIAQRAAEKIVSFREEGDRLFHGVRGTYFRVSINRYTHRARRDFELYLNDMLGVLKVFAPIHPIHPEVLVFYDETNPIDQAFVRQVIDPLQEHLKRLGQVAPTKPRISSFSGPMSDPSRGEDHDVMACMAGIHVWPTGEVALQEAKGPDDGNSLYDAPKGSRPTPTGQRLFQPVPNLLRRGISSNPQAPGFHGMVIYLLLACRMVRPITSSSS